MEALQKAIVGASLINTLFYEYEAGKLTSTGELIRSRVGKFMRQRAKTNRALFIDTINKTHNAWVNTINHYAKENMKIEAKFTITAIFNTLESEMTKFVNIKDKDFEKFMIKVTDDHEAEANSKVVVDFIMQQLGLEIKKSLFAGKKAIIKGNLITDGKAVKDGF